jgi:phage terminase large subunit-like protein
MGIEARQAKEALADALEAELDRLTYQGRLLTFEPYEKQKIHMELGRTKRERLLMAGNRLGKSETGAYEAACHLTGKYPKWWKGKKFDGPTKGWIAGVTWLDVRNVCQTKICGQYGVDALFGTGMIAKADLLDKSLGRNVTDAYDTIQVRHVSGGISIAQFKSYDQGRQKFQGEGLDWIWFDEEPPLDIYSEGLTRIGERDGVAWLTFTPLQGPTAVVLRYLDEPAKDRAVTTITIDEATHITPETKERMVAGYLPHEREARARGVPMLGSGRIFMATDESVIEAPIEYIPQAWTKLWGIDFGIDHPFAAALILWDRDNDVIHVHHTIRISDALPLQHAAAMKPIGINVPVAWPQDGTQRRDDGKPLADHYKRCGLAMLSEHATWPPPKGGVSTEAGVMEMDERERTGRLKYAAQLSDLLDERRFYHRKDGQIVKLKDDILSAVRIAIMMKRKARSVDLGGMLNSSPWGSGSQIAHGIDFDVFGGSGAQI